MSKEPLTIPVGGHIFKNLTSHGKSVVDYFRRWYSADTARRSGYWQTKWYKDHTRQAATLQLGCIVNWMLNGDVSPFCGCCTPSAMPHRSLQLKPPPSEIIPLKGSDEEVTQTVRDLIGRIQRGEMKQKPLLQWEE